tara:strand:+ start:182 stop:688 length:507 start_codon:yes stop_codon:yes gene_type:complete
MKWQIQLVMMITLISCHPDKNKSIALDELSFKTTDASELYFKNVRQSDYQLEEKPEAGMNVFRLEGLTLAAILKPAIIINWRNDMAFFYFEQLSESEELILEISLDGQKKGFDLSNQQNHAELARQLYNAILENKKIDTPNESVFETAEDRETFRRMYFDYLRLVDIR